MVEERDQCGGVSFPLGPWYWGWGEPSLLRSHIKSWEGSEISGKAFQKEEPHGLKARGRSMPSMFQEEQEADEPEGM